LTPSFENNIEIRDLAFSYEADRPVLANTNIVLHKNKKYAIVGQSGCGKSTLVRLLCGNYPLYDGSILYDGTELKALDIDKLQSMISVIHQNIYMFDDSIQQNIELCNTFSQEEMEGALKASGVLQFLDKMPHGIKSQVGENGANLSGGQRQRIAVARALIRKKPILILDEGTSSVDRQTAYDIESRLLNMNNLTLITITHHLNEELLSRYDQIIYMENGTILETGRFEELLLRQARFFEFYNLKK
jgi:ABC-type bacteriocin/lantibiotic exporter with double-glycine peptidase domain